MTRTCQTLCCILAFTALLSPYGQAQSGSFSSGAAGGAAAGALGGALNSGAGSTSSASAAGGGGSSAPIEVNIMVYRGLSQLAKSIAELTEQEFPEHGPILIEDPTSSLQIGLYESLMAYYKQL